MVEILSLKKNRMTIGSRPSTRRRYTPPRVGVILPLLHVAAREGHVSVAKRILTVHCNLDLLYLVDQYNHASVTEELIASHSNVDLDPEKGDTPHRH